MPLISYFSGQEAQKEEKPQFLFFDSGDRLCCLSEKIGGGHRPDVRHWDLSDYGACCCEGGLAAIIPSRGGRFRSW